MNNKKKLIITTLLTKGKHNKTAERSGKVAARTGNVYLHLVENKRMNKKSKHPMKAHERCLITRKKICKRNHLYVVVRTRVGQDERALPKKTSNGHKLSRPHARRNVRAPPEWTSHSVYF